MAWLVVYLVATSLLAGVAWVVLIVVYPGFALVGDEEWPGYHAAHTRAITGVVLVPWAGQGVATVALLVAPPAGDRMAAAVLAVLALAGVALTLGWAVPAHNRLGASPSGGGPALVTLLRAHLVRSVVWSAGALSAAVWAGRTT